MSRNLEFHPKDPDDPYIWGGPASLYPSLLPVIGPPHVEPEEIRGYIDGEEFLATMRPAHAAWLREALAPFVAAARIIRDERTQASEQQAEQPDA